MKKFRIYILMAFFICLPIISCTSETDEDNNTEQEQQDNSNDDEKEIPLISFQQVGNDLVAEQSLSCFGNNVVLNADGSRFVVGEACDDENGYIAGKISVFELVGDTWVKLGNSILGKNEDDNSGISVDINQTGDIVAFTGLGHNGQGGTGHCRVYQFIGAEWVQLGEDITPPSGVTGQFVSVEMNDIGNRVIIGNPTLKYNSSSISRGGAFVYEYNGNQWEQLGDVISLSCQPCTLAGGHNEVSMSGDGNTVAIGSSSESMAVYDFGIVEVFRLVNDEWVSIGESDNFIRRASRSSINQDGSRILVGGPDRGFEQRGAIKLFEINAGGLSEISVMYGKEFTFFADYLSLSGDGKRMIVGEPLFDTDENFDIGRASVVFEIEDSLCAVGEPIIGDAINNNDTSFGKGDVNMSADGKRIAISYGRTPGNGFLGSVKIYDIIEQ